MCHTVLGAEVLKASSWFQEKGLSLGIQCPPKQLGWGLSLGYRHPQGSSTSWKSSCFTHSTPFLPFHKLRNYEPQFSLSLPIRGIYITYIKNKTNWKSQQTKTPILVAVKNPSIRKSFGLISKLSWDCLGLHWHFPRRISWHTMSWSASWVTGILRSWPPNPQCGSWGWGSQSPGPTSFGSKQPFPFPFILVYHHTLIIFKTVKKVKKIKKHWLAWQYFVFWEIVQDYSTWVTSGKSTSPLWALISS